MHTMKYVLEVFLNLESYHIQGGNPILGEYDVKGAKNAALPILAASVVTGQRNYFFNCPDISDVAVMKKILGALGCKITEGEDFLEIDTSPIKECTIPKELMKEMRSSVFLVGPLLTRCGKAVIGQPGGCDIGARPIDIHIKALQQMGAKVEQKEDTVEFTAEKLTSADIYLDFPSVGATENIMVTALGVEGDTVICNSAREPEIVDLQRYLNSCGAKISGAGTSKIVVKGKQTLQGTCHKIMGDRIEAGTFLMAAACTGGELLLNGINPDVMKSVLKVLRYAGCKIKKTKNDIWLKGPERLFSIDKLQTKPYPGFPTDLQPQVGAIMTTAVGKCRIEENIFENRFKYIKQLTKMGGSIEISGRTAIIEGMDMLHGAEVVAEDLRGGAALVLAGLMAEGNTIVNNIHFVERGYANLHNELKKLGGNVEKKV